MHQHRRRTPKTQIKPAAGTGKLGDYLPKAGVAAKRYRARRDKVLSRLQRGSTDHSNQRGSQVGVKVF